MEHHILVIGATGMLGKPVAEQLHQAGFNVRLAVRSPEKANKIFGNEYEIVQGDVTDPASIRKALDGCYGVHINLKGGPTEADYERMEHQGTRTVVNAARDAGVQKVTYLSSYTAAKENMLSPESRAKWNAEETIRASGAPYTIFRATWFMESLPLFVQGKQAMVLGKQPHPLHWIAVQDYARMAAASYRTPETTNRELYMYGPQAFTMKQALELYIRLTAPDVKISTMPLWAMSLLGKITFNAEWQDMAQVMGFYDKVGESGSPAEANRLLGAPQTTLEQWCRAQGKH